MKVWVKDIHVIGIRPNRRTLQLQYVIITENQLGQTDTIWVDVSKFDKHEVELEIKRRHSARAGVPPNQIQVEWLVEPPEISITPSKA